MANKIKKKHEDSTRFKIMFTLIRKNNPMTLMEIAKETKLDKELVFHHLKKLKEDWLIAELENKTYACQSFLYDENMLDDLKFIMKIIVRIRLHEDQLVVGYNGRV